MPVGEYISERMRRWNDLSREEQERENPELCRKQDAMFETMQDEVKEEGAA